MMLHYVIVKTVILVALSGMRKTGCSGETRLVLHVPSSSWAGKRLTTIIVNILLETKHVGVKDELQWDEEDWQEHHMA